jgi:hypothetical protein
MHNHSLDKPVINKASDDAGYQYTGKAKAHSPCQPHCGKVRQIDGIGRFAQYHKRASNLKLRNNRKSASHHPCDEKQVYGVEQWALSDSNYAYRPNGEDSKGVPDSESKARDRVEHDFMLQGPCGNKGGLPWQESDAGKPIEIPADDGIAYRCENPDRPIGQVDTLEAGKNIFVEIKAVRACQVNHVAGNEEEQVNTVFPKGKGVICRGKDIRVEGRYRQCCQSSRRLQRLISDHAAQYRPALNNARRLT